MKTAPNSFRDMQGGSFASKHFLKAIKKTPVVTEGKNNKDKIMFNVNVTEEKTTVDEVDGFEILEIDTPPGIYEYELDTPPGINGFGLSGGQIWNN